MAEIILSYLLYGFSVVTLIMALGVIRKKSGGREKNYMFSCFCMASTLWSLCFGFILIQTNAEIAYYLRCVGMIGVFAYLITAAILLADWSEIQGKHIKVLKYSPIAGIVLYPFMMQRSTILFYHSEYGMTYTFTLNIWNQLYNIYCILTAADMIYMSVNMIFNKRRKNIRVLGKRTLLCVAVLLLGMFFDTFLPLYGLRAVPGSAITQFFGTILLYQGFNFYRFNCVTLSNMSEFVYYSVETPMLIYDEKKHLKIVNKSAVEFFSLPEKHQNIKPEQLFELNEDVLHSGVVQLKVDTKCLVRDAYCRLVINRIPDKYDEVLGYIIIVDDLTDKMQSIKELEEAKIRADMANRAKSTFLTQMSHEIRTPLNTVLGMDEMILRECESEKIRVHARYIQSAGRTLLGLINDILDLSKLESGKIQIVEDEYSLGVALHDILNFVSVRRKGKGLALELDIQEDVPNRLYGDELRVKQVLTNVLNNAVKYTEKGTIFLRLQWREVRQGEAELTFQVEDTGIGIRKEDMERLFKPYERLDEKKNYRIEGSCLGMAITKQLLELMNGEMFVESEYGKGSVFTLVLSQKIISRAPIGIIREEDELAPLEQQEEENNKHLVAPSVRILVVDDTISNLVIIQGLLKRTEIKVDMAKSGYDALRMVAKKQYQMIFLDHMMPEMDGIETLHEIRKMENNPNTTVPIIALTANAVLGAKEKYLASGFTDYLSKPVDAVILERMICRYLPEDMYNIVEEELRGQNDHENSSL